MYVPAANAEPRVEVMHDFVRAHPFGVLVTSTEEGLCATHLPFVLDRTAGPHGSLLGHIARANTHHRLANPSGEGLVIFQGPDAYITPSAYEAKREHGRVVPTWNYVAVHAHGVVRFRDDDEFLQRQVRALTVQQEAVREHPWSLEDAPESYLASMRRAIVGVEVEITRLEGNWKMSQNRSDADIDGVVAELARSPSANDRAVGQIVERVRPRRGASTTLDPEDRRFITRLRELLSGSVR